MTARQGQTGKTLLALLLVALLLVSGITFREELLATIVDLSSWVRSMGLAAPFLFVLLFVIAVPVFIPTSPLLLVAGLLFGFWWGCVLAFVGNLLGGLAAFWLGRTKMRNFTIRLLQKNHTLEAIDKAIAEEGVKTAALLRMSPILPGPLLNYALGVTRLGLRDYLFASVGTLPAIGIFVLVGSSLTRLSQLQDSASASLSTSSLLLVAAGLAATVLASLLLGRRVQRKLEQRDAEPELTAVLPHAANVLQGSRRTPGCQ